MKASSELHELIRGMNMSEKRYFKIYSSRHIIGERNNYMRLFDAIARQEVYAEAEIKKQFTGETFIRHLPSEKHYLYRQVLDSLNAFNREKTFLSRYSNILISVEILYNRGLFAQCHRLIRKAKKEAYSLEKFSMLLLLLRWETLIHIKNEDELNLNKSIAEELRILEMMRIQYVLMQVAFNVQVHIDRNNITPSFIRKSEKELKRNLPANSTVDSFWARYYYHSTLGLIASVQKKQMLRYHSYKEIKRLMDTAPQFIIDLPWIYHLNSNNLVNVMLQLKKYSEVELLIRQQRGFVDHYKIKRAALSRMIFLNTYESELFLCYKTHRHADAARIAATIEPEVKKIEAGFSPVLFDLVFFMAVSELMVQNYKSATRWLNRILNAERVTGFRKELQVNARLLYLAVLYESGDLLLENRLQSTRRFLQRETQFKTQKAIAEVIRLLAAGDPGHAQLEKHVASIRADFKKPGGEWLNKQFDFAEWILRQVRLAKGRHVHH
ncbi:MAG TPA: hypothetical protein VI112_16645 [Bacteroidia bacterium]